MVSPSGLAALAGAEAGDRIVITWSGFESRASGIRTAMPDDGSGLWGSNRFLLQATFVELGAAGRYLTFKTESQGEPGDGAGVDAGGLGQRELAAPPGGWRPGGAVFDAYVRRGSDGRRRCRVRRTAGTASSLRWTRRPAAKVSRGWSRRQV